MPSATRSILKWFAGSIMRKYVVFIVLVILLLTTSACAVSESTSSPSGSTVVLPPNRPEKSVGTPTPQSAPTESPANILTNSCDLLDSRDLASFFTSHTEVKLPAPQISQVNHPIFSLGNATGKETSCVYYTYHLPGSNAEVVLQVNYWVDVPDPTTSSDAWVQAWDQAKLQASQSISGIGEDAFFEDGRLTFRVRDLFMTIEATETDWDLNTSTGLNKQATTEKQLALDMLSRMD